MNRIRCILFFLLIVPNFVLPLFSCSDRNRQSMTENVGSREIKKVKNIVIYEDTSFYSTFPSIVKNDDDGFIAAFRRAPDRRIFGERRNRHTDPNSYLVMVRSRDGETWTTEPELIYAHPFGGSQDPCLLRLRDGTLLCTSYGWSFINQDEIDNLKTPYFDNRGGVVFLGGYLVRSVDGGKTWQGPIYPPHVDEEIKFNALGDPLPAYNRGALCEGKNGSVYWVVAVNDSIPVKKTSNHLLVSNDKGLTWSYSGVVATDDKASFNEASIYETPKGDLVAFLRTANMDDQACIARSTDGGKTFQWEQMGFQGHPCHALRLPDDRVLLTYGYRHQPYGIRARVLNAECTDYATSTEIILRDDGGNTDIGYTWSVMLDNNRILVIYYFNKDNGTRHIAGTILAIE
jgi:sialidase-1